MRSSDIGPDTANCASAPRGSLPRRDGDMCNHGERIPVDFSSSASGAPPPWGGGTMTSFRRSLLFSFIGRYAGIVIGLGMTMAAARLLTPADFGVFAVGLSAVMLIDVLRDFGTAAYLERLEAPERSVVRSAFTVSCIISGSCAAALVLAAIPLGRFYDEPGVGNVVLVMSAALLLNPFMTPATAADITRTTLPTPGSS